MTDAFTRLAADHRLDDRRTVSPAGLPERYLYSLDMVYRYAYGRWWGQEDVATTDVWVMLNPATGDTERRHRPTLERCVARSRADGRDGVLIVNLFAFRHTDPKQLLQADDAVGPANDDALRVLTARGARTIAAWGGRGRLMGRSGCVGPLLDRPLCLGTTRRGEPRHPLYVASAAPLVPWTGPDR